MLGISFGSMAQATDLIISEYSEGSSNNKYLEIYNATGDSVDLADYELWRISNGGAWPESTSALSGWLQDNSVIVVANSQSDPAILALPNVTTAYNSATFFNGDDAVGLAKNDGTGTFTLIDAVGTYGADPGSAWDVAGTTNGTANHTLVRKASVCSPDTTWSTTAGTTAANSEWIVFPQDTWTDAGMHASSCAAPTSSDTTKPMVMDGVYNSATSITVVYSEPVTMATATDVSNYVLTPGVTVTSAVQSTSLDSVTLTFTPALANGTLYTVDISNVADTSANANVMDPFNTTFYFNSYNGSDLMITEVMYGQNSSGVQDIDYFEIYNSGTAAVSLAGMELVNGMDLGIDSNVSIAAGGYLVITENVDSFMVAFPTVTNVIGVSSGSLSGGGELIAIENSLGDVVVSLDYETSAPWPGYTADGSIELCDLTSDNTDGANWYYAGTVASTVADMLYGTPGAANSCAAKPIIPTYDIEVIMTNDANGEPDSIDVYCAIEGIVHGKDLDGNAGYTFVMVDDTRGTTVHSFVDVDNYVVNQGDELRCVGSVKFFNGLTQFRVDSITILSTGNCIDFPAFTIELGEETESEPIYLPSVRLVDPLAWPTPGNNANLEIINMDGDTLVMRIDRDTEIADTITAGPTGFFNVSGTGGQFDGSSPYDEGYQIFPHFVSDIDTLPSTVTGLFINEVLVDNQSVNMDPQGDYDSWIEIYNSNSTAADLTGLLIGNDDTVYQFSRCEAAVTVPANGFKLLWADNQPEQGADHLPFELLDEDFLGFATKDLAILDTLEWDSTLADVSFGRSVDGAGTWVSFEVTTPEATNENGVLLSVINAIAANPINVYPNPSNTGNVNFNKVVSFNMFSITGQLVMTQNKVNRVNVSSLEKGVYIIETAEGEVVKVILK
jgi:hypothetical protein